MPAQAQAPANSGGIYACTGYRAAHHGRQTPLPPCVDREQRAWHHGRRVAPRGPTLTDQERSAQEAKRRQDQAERSNARVRSASRDRTALARFPIRAA